MSRAASCLLAALLVAARPAAAQKVEVNLTSEPILRERLERGAVPLKQRQVVAADLFREVGCPPQLQPVDKTFANVICTLPGETADTIIIGAHHDFIERGKGIIDDWSGTAMLSSLYEALKHHPRRHTYVFVAFAKEERGLLGSHLYVRNLKPEDRAQVRAYINLECLGLSPAKVWYSRSTPALVQRLNEIAAVLSVTVDRVNVDRVGDDDTHPFLNARLPVVSIHSISQETFGLLHSSLDRVDYVQRDDYRDAYRLVAFYLAYLDTKLQPPAVSQ